VIANRIIQLLHRYLGTHHTQGDHTYSKCPPSWAVKPFESHSKWSRENRFFLTALRRSAATCCVPCITINPLWTSDLAENPPERFGFLVIFFGNTIICLLAKRLAFRSISKSLSPGTGNTYDHVVDAILVHSSLALGIDID